MHVQVVSDLVGALPEEHNTSIYRVVQVVLNNFARLVQDSMVLVAVRGETGKILLSVQGTWNKNPGSAQDDSPSRIHNMTLFGRFARYSIALAWSHLFSHVIPVTSSLALRIRPGVRYAIANTSAA